MNGYERALQSLTFDETDCAATWGGWVVSDSFFEYVTGKKFWDSPRAVAIEAYQQLGVDVVTQWFYLPHSPSEWREYSSESIKGASRFNSPEDILHYIEYLPCSEDFPIESHWKAKELPRFDFDNMFVSMGNDYARFQEELGPDILCLPTCKKARFHWYMSFGFENFLVALALYPDAMKELFLKTAEESRMFNSVSAELVKTKRIPPFFFVGDDLCGNSGPIASPNTLRELYFPALTYALEPLVEIGADIIWHSDGYIIPVLDDLIGCGVSGFQGFQQETGFKIKDIREHKVRNGRNPLLMAGLSDTLPLGTVLDVKHEVEEIVDSVACDGGVLVGTATTAGPDCPNENLETLYCYAHEYRSKKHQHERNETA